MALAKKVNVEKVSSNQQPPKKEAEQKILKHELDLYQIELEAQNRELQRVQDGLQNQQVELELQNDELRLAREEIELARNKYTELYDFAPVGYFTFDQHGVIQEANITGAQLLGIEKRLLTNLPFSRFIANEDGQNIFTAHLETVLHNNGMHKCELRLVGKDSTIIYGLLQSVAMGLYQSSEGHILCSMVDVTVARMLKTEIQDAKEYAENIVETVREPLVVMNSNLKILTANHSFYDTFKVIPEDTIGNFIYDIGNRQWDIPKLRVLFEDILPHDTVFNGYEVEHDFPGIGRKSILLNAREIFRENIGSHIILLAMEDITARKQAEAERARLDQRLKDKNIELERATLAAENANHAKSDFLSSMSHELRTPLSAILGFAQLMESGIPGPTVSQKRSIDQILKAGWYLLELINEILDLALIESGKLSMSLEAVSLHEVMHECETMVEPQATKHGIGVSFMPFVKPCFVRADRTRLKQVLINLLSNAIKYNKSGGAVVVESRLNGPDSIRVSVKDTGDGLSPAQIAQLFQPFNRLGQEASDEQGTGIGLVVAKRLLELVGGSIGVESTVGVGSVFWVELNLTTEPLQEKQKAEALTTAQMESGVDEPLHTLLYIEDNPANLMLVEDIIARRPDIRLITARNGKDGIELARTALPDVILMDINLPGISGIDAMRILGIDYTTAHIPVIALSANAMPRDIEKGLESGFYRYLTKPIKVDKFMETLDMTLNYARIKGNS